MLQDEISANAMGSTSAARNRRIQEIAAELLRLRLQITQHQQLEGHLQNASTSLRRVPVASFHRLRTFVLERLQDPGGKTSKEVAALLGLLECLLVVCPTLAGAGRQDDLVPCAGMLEDPASLVDKLINAPLAAGHESRQLAPFLLACDATWPGSVSEVRQCYDELRSWLGHYYQFSLVYKQGIAAMKEYETLQQELGKEDSNLHNSSVASRLGTADHAAGVGGASADDAAGAPNPAIDNSAPSCVGEADHKAFGSFARELSPRALSKNTDAGMNRTPGVAVHVRRLQSGPREGGTSPSRGPVAVRTASDQVTQQSKAQGRGQTTSPPRGSNGTVARAPSPSRPSAVSTQRPVQKFEPACRSARTGATGAPSSARTQLRLGATASASTTSVGVAAANVTSAIPRRMEPPCAVPATGPGPVRRTNAPAARQRRSESIDRNSGPRTGGASKERRSDNKSVERNSEELFDGAVRDRALLRCCSLQSIAEPADSNEMEDLERQRRVALMRRQLHALSEHSQHLASAPRVRSIQELSPERSSHKTASQGSTSVARAAAASTASASRIVRQASSPAAALGTGRRMQAQPRSCVAPTGGNARLSPSGSAGALRRGVSPTSTYAAVAVVTRAEAVR
mmetsp:Transcript_32791/g.59954  ORF Transcript_32791/g.59954 Transcript_32791/m.59954 type:complete len:628 (+) Transcript_32791:65-1948(+)